LKQKTKIKKLNRNEFNDCFLITHITYIMSYHILFPIITLLILHIGLQIKNQYWYTMYKQKTKTIYNVLFLDYKT